MPASVLEQTAPLKCLFLFFGINSLLYRSKSDCSFCPGCLRVRCLNASMYPPAPMMYQNRMIPRKRKESRLHQPSNQAERPELPMECILVPQEKDYLGWQRRIAFWCNLGRKNLLPGRKCLSDLIRDSRGGVKVLYKYTGARHSRNSWHLSGGRDKCHLYQTMPSPSTHVSPICCLYRVWWIAFMYVSGHISTELDKMQSVISCNCGMNSSLRLHALLSSRPLLLNLI